FAETAQVASAPLILDQRRFFLNPLRAVGGRGVIAQELFHTRWITSGFALQSLEEARKVERIVTGARHDLRAHHISLRLGLAAVFEKERVEAQAANRADDGASRAGAQ